MKNWFFLFCGLLAVCSAQAQTISGDSLKMKPGKVVVKDSAVITVPDSVLASNKSKKFIPNPSIATKLALIPGGGQAYNRDYWKLPIIYAGIGGGVYAYFLNNAKYHDYLTAYRKFYYWADDPATTEIIETAGTLMPDASTGTRPVWVRTFWTLKPESTPGKGEWKEGSIDQIKRGKDYWRRNKNLSIIVAVAIYGLTIIEANVAAHLKTFDLTDDLSLNIEPKFNQPMMTRPTPGLRLVFNFKH